MKMLHQTQPATWGAKVYEVAGWALFGLFTGILAYPILFDFIAFGFRPGWHEGAGFGLVFLMVSPWGWSFLALCAFSLAMIPVMAIYRGAGANYGRFVFSLMRVWAGSLGVMGMIAVFVYHGLALGRHTFDGWRAESFIGLFLLNIPAVLVMVMVILGGWNRAPGWFRWAARSVAALGLALGLIGAYQLPWGCQFQKRATDGSNRQRQFNALATATAPAIDLVQPGTDMIWKNGNEDCVLHVTKRVGNSLEGIKIITLLHGQQHTITADTGNLSPGSAGNTADDSCVRITVRNAKSQSGSESATLLELMLVLHK